MHNLILVAAVLAGGAVGTFLLGLAERRAAEEQTAGPEENTGPWSGKQRSVLIGCALLCGGAMTAFLELFYHDTVFNIVNILLLYHVLWPCAWADLRAKLIPNSVLLYGALLRCGMLGAELFLLPQDVPLDLIRSGVAVAALCVVTVLCRLVIPGSIGFGDMKLLMLMGFFLGTDRVWSCVFCAMAASFVCSLFLLLTRRANMKTEIPYAPFLLLGTVMAAFLVNV